MLNDLEIYALIFFTYSILGWIMEVTVKYIQPENSTDLPSTRQFVNLTAGFTYNQVD